ncbi:MAG: DEAD/DEAH box helicase [Sphingomonadales bacterium]|nr:DEAD/DEAH box helicase [Sphingomonadales bacterium]
MAMEVVNTQPFEVVFTFVRHPYFGLLVEANAVQLLANGDYSLTYQRVRQQTTSYFNLNKEQTEVVRILEEFEVDSLMKRFYTGNKRIRSSEFLLKHYTPDLHKQVRPYIEKKLSKVLDIIKNYPMYWAGKTGQAQGEEIHYSEEPATVLFHFRRNEQGTNYFATIRNNNEKVEFYHNDSEIISENPAWLITPNRLLYFPKHIDGKKIRPFLTKKHIHVEPHQEDSYMDKFVKPLLENHDVFAKGLQIVTEQLPARPVIRLNKLFQDKQYLSLYFQYGGWNFPFHIHKKVNVSLEKKGNDFIFHRIRRSLSLESEKIALLKELGLENVEGSLFALQNEGQSYELISWLNTHSELLQRNGFQVDQEASDVRFYLGAVSLDVKLTKGADWFDVLAVVRFGTFEIPFIRLKKNILEKRREFILPNGEIAILPDEWFTRFGKIAHLADVEGDCFRVRNMHFSLLDDLSDYVDVDVAKSGWEKLLQSENIPEYPLPAGMNAELRHYQVEGYNWIRFLFEHRIGALLADDMGLGKTLQTLAVIKHISGLPVSEIMGESVMVACETPVSAEIPQLDLFTPAEAVLNGTIPETEIADKPMPCLVVAPKSLLYNWQAEAEKFCPSLKTLIYTGISRNRLLPKFAQNDLIIMSYGTLRNDIEELQRIPFRLVVIDESQAIKNPTSLTARSLLKIGSAYRLALTGTPIENTLLDVWSQMNFLNRGLLGSYGYFEKNFIRPIERNQDAGRTTELKRILNPFVLRRTKKQVAKELPPKVEKVHYCEMAPEQAECYEKTKSTYRNEILEHVSQVGMARSRLKIFNGLMHLRQLALNPVLKDGDYEGQSGKDDEIRRMLQRAVKGGHKVLLFSQFVSYLSVFEDMLQADGIEYSYLDGSMDEKERAEAIKRFQENDHVKVFLLSLRAGNAGLNLTAADYVFLADPWWNPFTMRQAEDRAHRIGQEKAVFSYKFITKNTIEEKILDLQKKKTHLAESIIPDEDSILSGLNVQELEDLLA